MDAEAQHAPPDDDLDAIDLIEQMERLLSEFPGSKVYVKWTCPACGQRCMSDAPNTFFADGYQHTDDHCGHVYTGDRFGFMAIYAIDLTEAATR